jgi:hypothetical protein
MFAASRKARLGADWTHFWMDAQRSSYSFLVVSALDFRDALPIVIKLHVFQFGTRADCKLRLRRKSAPKRDLAPFL